MPAPSLTYTLSNNTTADASQVMQNFNDLLNGITDGTKDLSINALTLAGALTANGNVTLGNSSSDTLTVTASLASNLVPSADGTYSLGSATIGYANLYLSGNSNQVTVKASASTSGDWTFTLPVSGGTNNYLLTTNGSGTSAWTAITNSAWYADGSNAGTLSATTQTIGGAKTFSAAATFSSGLVLGTGSTLSNYSTTTWTPAGALSTAGSSSNSAQSGRYTRIGNIIYFQGSFTFTKGTGTGTFTITGLPTNGVASPSGGAWLTDYGGITGASDLVFETNNGTTIGVYKPSGVNNAALTDAELDAGGSTFQFWGFYFV